MTIWQPDLSKTGGITGALRIAAMASAFGITAPTTRPPSTTATLRFLAALDNGGYFEACVGSSIRCATCSSALPTGARRLRRAPEALDRPGHRRRVFAEFPAIDGPSAVVKFWPRSPSIDTGDKRTKRNLIRAGAALALALAARLPRRGGSYRQAHQIVAPTRPAASSDTLARTVGAKLPGGLGAGRWWSTASRAAPR